MTATTMHATVTAATIGIVSRAHFHWNPCGGAAVGSRKTGKPVIAAPHPLQNDAGSVAFRPHLGHAAG